ncbi:MAG: Gfo/Idh/MocA family oxidoreductase [Nitrospirae bacterium]|nr:Gfo/Idh/MocA family oxidoreductase [Nitrospirota bacterium]MCL5976680.1 Gfo/Idh/MocA family oxidoreductase [Nitrospirota bacterium]
MRILVVGAGSIGSRHIRNLIGLGHDVYAVDINAANLEKAKDLCHGVFGTIEEALKNRYDAAFICTFSNDHIAPALACAEAGCHLFIEKPLSLTMDGVDNLVNEIERRRLISMVGCNMRFHPAIAAIHQAISSDAAFGKPLCGNFESGFYLPFDKPNYRQSYKARRNLGGNLLFDGIHELDYATWLFGMAQEVLCTKGIVSSLDIDTEDHVEIIVKFSSGAVCTIHMDYLQHGYSRRSKVVCESGTIVWDFVQGALGRITTQNPTWAWQPMQIDLSYNQMYIDEVAYFIECIRNGRDSFNSVKDSVSVLRLACAAERSSRTHSWEEV